MKYIFLFALLFSFTACVTKKDATGNPIGKKANPKVNFHITLTAENLSEDATILSSQNDEIVFLAYVISPDTTQLPQLILSEYHVYDSQHMSYDYVSDSIASPVKGDLYFVVLEIDDDKTKEQIEPVVRLNFRTINRAFLANDLQTLTIYFGDNDVLGIASAQTEKTDFKKENSIVISGDYLFDSYKYDLIFKE